MGDRGAQEPRRTAREPAGQSPARRRRPAPRNTRAWRATRSSAGDRVQTEYYLQFADHYFPREREPRPFRRAEPAPPARYDFDDEDGGDEEMAEAENDAEASERDDVRIAASGRTALLAASARAAAV